MRARSLLAPLVAVLAAGCAGESDRPPVSGVVLFSIDTLRVDALGPWGGSTPTPAIDRLAAEGLTFARAYTQSSHTHPAMTSVLTGLLPLRHGVRGQNGRPAPGVAPLASLLRENGYETASFVANLCRLQDEDGTVWREGWDVRGCGMDWSRDHHAWDETVVDDALAWIDGRTGPFFTWIHLMDPHAEHRPPPDLWNREADPLLPRAKQMAELNGWEERRELPPPDQLARLRALYDAEVAGADRQLARVLAALDAREDANELALVFTSDHGEELFETWPRHGHGLSLTEGVLHVPLIVRAPGVAPGRSDALVETLQVTPTVLELTGTPAPYALDGPSLLGPDAGRDQAFSFALDLVVTLRTPDRRFWFRRTSEPVTHAAPDFPWRTDTRWFRRRRNLAAYPGPLPTTPQWLPLREPEHAAEASRLKAEMDRVLSALTPVPWEERELGPEALLELEAIGY
jgi:arylsulfatase A-like enzyme